MIIANLTVSCKEKWLRILVITYGGFLQKVEWVSDFIALWNRMLCHDLVPTDEVCVQVLD